MLIQNGANLAQISVDGETTVEAIFKNVAKPAEFFTEIFSTQINLSGSEKCGADFCVTTGLIVEIILFFRY